MNKPTLCIDYDDTIWDNQKQAPLPGARDALSQLAKKYDLIVLTARPDTGQARNQMLMTMKLNIPVTNIKPSAVAYIDDKGYHFEGWDKVLKDF